MCLGVPGRVIAIEADPAGMTMGRVEFGGVIKEVCLACVPDAEVGNYVLVHAGFAISRIDEAEAQEVFRLLEELETTAELETTEELDEAERQQSR